MAAYRASTTKTSHRTIDDSVTVHIVRGNGDGTVTAKCGVTGRTTSANLGCLSCRPCQEPAATADIDLVIAHA